MLINVINYSLLYSVPYNTIAAVAGFLLVVVSVYFLKKRVFLCIVLTSIVILNIMSGYHFIQRVLLPFDNSFISLSELNDFKNEDKVYMFGLSHHGVNRVKAQMSLPGTDITFIYSLDHIQDTGVILMMEHQHLFTPEILSRVSIADMQYTNKMIVALEYAIDQADSSITLPMDLFRSQNGVREGKSITSDGNLGHVVFGPYIALEPGEYLFTAELVLLGNLHGFEMIIEADIVAGSSMFAERDFEPMDFVDNRYFLEFRVEVEEPVSGAQFRILTVEGVILQVSNITIALVQSYEHTDIME